MSHFWLINEFLPGMLNRNKGHIVAVSSITSMIGTPYLADYSATKAASSVMMEGIRMEFKRNKQNIRCTTISPYFIDTGMFEGAKGSFLYPFLKQEETVNRMVYGIL
jgi:all-trans-retinol dehydrogenase (NAD+)